MYADWALGEFTRVAARRRSFPDALFVIVAEHTSNGRGRIGLPPANYRGPPRPYAPGRIAPGRVEATASLVDVPTTLLAQIGSASTEGFFGVDMRDRGRRHTRGFLANYLTVGPSRTAQWSNSRRGAARACSMPATAVRYRRQTRASAL